MENFLATYKGNRRKNERTIFRCQWKLMDSLSKSIEDFEIISDLTYCGFAFGKSLVSLFIIDYLSLYLYRLIVYKFQLHRSSLTKEMTTL